MPMSARERFIRTQAARLGLDPNAVVADSLGEGAAALRGGNSIGDHGTSFGPFQLHIGGALPSSVAAKGARYANAWANSAQGITYALRQMAADGARGKVGRAAVAAIVSGFERPADIPGQIAIRDSYLGKSGGSPISGGGLASLPQAGGGGGLPSLGGLSSSPANPEGLNQLVSGFLMQQAQNTLQGKPTDPSSLLGLALARGQLTAANQNFGPLPNHPVGQPKTAPAGATTHGDIHFTGVSLDGVNPAFLGKVSQAVQAIGGTVVRVASGVRSPAHNAAVGGVSHSNHITGHAIDASVYVPGRGWTPLGTALRGVAGKYGLRSGDQPGFFNGGPDPVHVDDGFNQH